MTAFSIVNSTIIAPHKVAAVQLRDFVRDNKSKEIFRNFIIEHGPFDVIHFQTLEGIAPNVLELKDDFPSIRIVHSVHDYGIVCPNVKLWTNTKQNCFINQQCRDCGKCMKLYARENLSWKKADRPSVMGMDFSVPPSPVVRFRKMVRKIRQKFGCPKWLTDGCVSDFRNNNINKLNKYADIVLCVSNRVAEIMESFGIEKSKIRVYYIGTKVADNAEYKLRTNPQSKVFTLLFMGYAIEEKGFFFLLDSLEKMHDVECENIALKFATKISNQQILDRIYALRNKFHSVVLYNGYTHEDFANIMNNVNLGIVPPLWEDNFPQVAVEMVANGIPALTSCFGGAHELNSLQEFTFNNSETLQKCIINIFHNRKLLIDYWKSCNKLVTMDSHMKTLIEIYSD